MDTFTIVFSVQVPREEMTPELLREFGYSELEIERYLRAYQLMQPEQIERNRRLMKAGKIEFDEYEEVS